MSLLAGIGIFIEGIVSVVAPVIGSALSTAATFIATKLPEMLQVATTCVSTISTIVTSVGEMLKIAPPEEQPAELGAKIMQENVRSKREGELTQEYLDYLRTVPFDEGRFDKMSEEEKLGCEVVGDVMLADSIRETTNVDLPGEFLMTLTKINMVAQTVYNLIKSFEKSGISSMGQFNDYLSGDIINEEVAEKVDGAVKSAISATSPEMSITDIQHEIIAMRQAYKAEN
ncbi:hypothetical protein [Lachnospira eligens]|uniref:hypothetical protein n=1 Tax=Lachnospira eligens TaxID=39485 RepID=UPI000E46D730|nr:hypothetical protein [Lachnospira eligens]RHI69129.1 hypothetical protein DW160_01760 [Lachnospira eligens]